jgi:hypothetical protein
VKRHGQLDGALRDLERDLAVERDVAAVVEVEQVERHVVGAGVDRGLGDEPGAARLVSATIILLQEPVISEVPSISPSDEA